MAMEHANKRFNHAEELLLKQMKGSKLLTIDAVLAAPPDNSWNTVRLHFEGFDIDVNNFLNNIVVDEFGTLEEFGLLSVVESSEEMLSIPEVGADTTTGHRPPYGFGHHHARQGGLVLRNDSSQEWRENREPLVR